MDAIEKHRLVATGLGLGYLTKAPGTVASLAAALAAAGAIALGRFVSGPALAFGLLAVAAAWLWFRGRRAVHSYSRILTPEWKKDGRKIHFDHSIFVVDEVLGMLVAALPLAWLDPVRPGFWLALAASFALFRALDIAKPWPISRIDRTDRPLNVMMDDAAAGLLASLPGWLYLLFF